MTIPQGFDPLFPNKRLIGYGLKGAPLFDMAAAIAEGVILVSISDPVMGDMTPQFKHGQWWTMYSALLEYEAMLVFNEASNDTERKAAIMRGYLSEQHCIEWGYLDDKGNPPARYGMRFYNGQWYINERAVTRIKDNEHRVAYQLEALRLRHIQEFATL